MPRDKEIVVTDSSEVVIAHTVELETSIQSFSALWRAF
jgi:hypothetical protein